MKKLHISKRFRNAPFVAALLALLGYVLVEFNVIDVGRWEHLSQLIMGILIAGGIVVNPLTPGMTDDKEGDGQ